VNVNKLHLKVMLIAKRVQIGSGFFDSHIPPLAKDWQASPFVLARPEEIGAWRGSFGALRLLTRLPSCLFACKGSTKTPANKDLGLNAELGFGYFHYSPAPWTLA
jgi:hypothetical protein